MNCASPLIRDLHRNVHVVEVVQRAGAAVFHGVPGGARRPDAAVGLLVNHIRHLQTAHVVGRPLGQFVALALAAPAVEPVAGRVFARVRQVGVAEDAEVALDGVAQPGGPRRPPTLGPMDAPCGLRAALVLDADDVRWVLACAVLHLGRSVAGSPDTYAADTKPVLLPCFTLIQVRVVPWVPEMLCPVVLHCMFRSVSSRSRMTRWLPFVALERTFRRRPLVSTRPSSPLFWVVRSEVAQVRTLDPMPDR